MKRTLSIQIGQKQLKVEIDSGDTTCASAPGDFCPWFATMKFGQLPCCALFAGVKQSTLRDKYLLEVGAGKNGAPGEGWTLRCNDCLMAELTKETQAW